jgi:hypothetical protein
MKYCQIERDMEKPNQNTMIFSIDDSKYISLNLIPKSFTQEMTALVQYRLVNKMEQEFIYETLVLMIIGLLLIFFFGSVLYKALTNNIFNESYQHIEDRAGA